MKANDLLDMIGNVDDNIIEEAKQKKKAIMPKWTKWLATAACLCIVLGGIAPGGFNVLHRLGYFSLGCGALPGTIVDDQYYYFYPYSGIWRYSNGSAKKAVSAYWVDNWSVYENGLYYKYKQKLYRIDRQTLKKKKIYSASAGTVFSYKEADQGNLILTIYNKEKTYYYKILIDGINGEFLEQLTERIPYDDTGGSDTNTHYIIGDRDIELVPIGEASERKYMPTENGKALLPDGSWVHDFICNFCEEVKSFEVYNGSDVTEESEVLIIFADGKTYLKPKEEKPFYAGTIGHILLYVDHDDPENYGSDGSGIWCYDPDSKEKWELKTDTEHSFYSFTNDDKMLYSCEPWNHDQAAWKIVYEGNRPVALQLIDDKITD